MKLLLLFNIISCIAMFLDKRYAIKHKRRISESMLMTLALFGPVGSLIGMYTFRHKTKHLKFVLGVPLILIIECMIYFYII